MLHCARAHSGVLKCLWTPPQYLQYLEVGKLLSELQHDSMFPWKIFHSMNTLLFFLIGVRKAAQAQRVTFNWIHLLKVGFFFYT